MCCLLIIVGLILNYIRPTYLGLSWIVANLTMMMRKITLKTMTNL